MPRETAPRETARTIDAQAARWAARVDRGPLTAGDAAALAVWLDQDVRRMGAYARMRAICLATQGADAAGSACCDRREWAGRPQGS